MSAGFRSVTGHAHHFEPLNAKQLERPGGKERGIGLMDVVRPCGVVQSTRLPLMQEITGAKPVWDTSFIRPQSIVSDAFAR